MANFAHVSMYVHWCVCVSVFVLFPSVVHVHLDCVWYDSIWTGCFLEPQWTRGWMSVCLVQGKESKRRWERTEKKRDDKLCGTRGEAGYSRDKRERDTEKKWCGVVQCGVSWWMMTHGLNRQTNIVSRNSLY